MHNKYFAIIGEVIGTGIIGGLLAFPIAKFIMGKNVLAFFFVYPFLLSTVGGAIIALVLLKISEKIDIFNIKNNTLKSK